MKKYFRFIKFFVFLVFSASVLALPSFAQSETSPIERIDTALNGLAKSGQFSGSILIAHQGELVLNQGYGYANLEWKIPNAPDTKFRIADLTAQFTAMAILKLQEQGALNIQDKICLYLESCPETWQDITIYQLLTHTSGIPSYFDYDPNNSLTLAKISLSSQEVLKLFIERPLDFPAGSNWNYSNSGYHLLGMIIENVSGQSYERYLNDNFFKPLGMKNTGLDRNYMVIGNRAEGYANLTTKTRAEYFEIRNAFSAGGLYSTTEDLYIWQQALFGGKVISQDRWDSMLKDAYLIPGTNVYYAYGLAIDSVEGKNRISHGGGLPGFASLMEYYPDDDLTIIILSNYEGADIFTLLSQVIVGAILA